MDILNSSWINQLKLGEVQKFDRLSIIPLMLNQNPRMDYKTLGEIDDLGQVEIAEIDSAGSVPELDFNNNSNQYILLVDGEELVGAKQNRALNTTMMAEPNITTRIPVSCTESGRWSYSSKTFRDSGVFMPYTNRYSKKLSVDDSLRQNASFRSDQRRVWDDINSLEDDAQQQSPTNAMRDVFQSRSNDLEDFTREFRYVPGQKGIAALVDGKVAGLEFFSKDTVMESMLPKLINSYAMDIILGRVENTGGTISGVTDFLKTISTMEPEIYPSAGTGLDYRFDSEEVTGSALICNEEVIHAAFYNTTLNKAR